MNVKCKICGQKGYHDESKVSEFWASRFLFVSRFFNKKHQSYYICRNCIINILSSLSLEQSRIDALHEPRIKEKS